MGFIIPTKTEILEAMRTNQYRPLLDKIFGDRWFEKLDPRMYLGITYEEFVNDKIKCTKNANEKCTTKISH